MAERQRMHRRVARALPSAFEPKQAFIKLASGVGTKTLIGVTGPLLSPPDGGWDSLRSTPQARTPAHAAFVDVQRPATVTA